MKDALTTNWSKDTRRGRADLTREFLDYIEDMLASMD